MKATQVTGKSPQIPAVTVSVFYTGFLRATRSNEKHLSPWIIATTPDDQELIAAGYREVMRHGVRSGSGFHAAFNKAAWINAGLRALRAKLRAERGRNWKRTDDWVASVDADTLLPEDFGERIANLLPLLDPRKLYGMRGRRVAATPEEFEALKIAGPWESGLDRFATVIGYFNLFHLHGPHPFYPPSDADRREHDDLRFSAMFGKENVVSLPMTALHLGATSVHWGGTRQEIGRRHSNSTHLAASRSTSPPQGTARSVRARKSALGAFELPDEDCILLGAWRPEVAVTLAAHHRRVLLVDTRGLAERSEDKFADADREFCWRRFVRGVEGCGNLFRLGSKTSTARSLKARITNPSAAPEAQVRDGLPFVPLPASGTVGRIALGMEPSYDVLIEQLPNWLHLLRPGGWITGTHYGFPAFPRTTPGIELLLGMPAWTDESGGWAMQLGGEGDSPLASLQRSLASGLWNPQSLPRQDKAGVALWVFDEEDARTALTALHSLRNKWRGPLAVLNWGKESPPLRIACARFEASHVGIVTEARARQDAALVGKLETEPADLPRERAMALSLPYSPFERTLLLTVGAHVPITTRWLSTLRRTAAALAQPAQPATASPSLPLAFAYVRDSRSVRHWQARLRESVTEPSDIGLPPFRVATVHGGFTRELLASPKAENALLASMPVRVWLPEDVTIVMAVMPEDFQTVRRNWTAIRWPEETRLLIVAGAEIPEDQLPTGAELLDIPDSIIARFPNEPYWNHALLAALQITKTKSLLYMDPCLRPLPGARLFSAARESEATYCSGGWAFARRGKTVLKFAKLGPPATLVNVAWLRSAVRDFQKNSKRDSMEVHLHLQALREKRDVIVSDVMACGWNL